MNIQLQATNLTNDIKNLIATSQEKAIDYQRVLLYWNNRIFPIANTVCSQLNQSQYTLPQNNQTILASKYQLYLPSEEELVKELCKELQEIKIFTC